MDSGDLSEEKLGTYCNASSSKGKRLAEHLTAMKLPKSADAGRDGQGIMLLGQGDDHDDHHHFMMVLGQAGNPILIFYNGR